LSSSSPVHQSKISKKGAGHYTAFILSRLGYDIGITIGRAKVFDLIAVGASGKEINIQVKSTYEGYAWLVGVNGFNSRKNSMVALVRLKKDPSSKPELYLISGERANELITHEYKTHAPRISRADVQQEFGDHDLRLISQLLGDKYGDTGYPNPSSST